MGFSNTIFYKICFNNWALEVTEKKSAVSFLTSAKWLDVLVFSDEDENSRPWAANNISTDLTLVGQKEQLTDRLGTSASSSGKRWCLSFQNKGMGREGRVHVLYLRP